MSRALLGNLFPWACVANRKWHIESHYPTQAKVRLEWATQRLWSCGRSLHQAAKQPLLTGSIFEGSRELRSWCRAVAGKSTMVRASAFMRGSSALKPSGSRGTLFSSGFSRGFFRSSMVTNAGWPIQAVLWLEWDSGSRCAISGWPRTPKGKDSPEGPRDIYISVSPGHDPSSFGFGFARIRERL